jgi:hypothetical protein
MFGKSQYLAKANIWQKPIFMQYAIFSNIWQNMQYAICNMQYAICNIWQKANIWQKPMPIPMTMTVTRAQ